MTPKKIILIVISCALLVITLIIGGVFLLLNSAANSAEISLSGETIPTIQHIVGKRKITGMASSLEIDTINKEYSYNKVDNVISDIKKYVNHLTTNENFYILKDCDLSKPTGVVQLGKQSIESDKIILLNIDYSLGTYTISVQKRIGTITPK